MGLYSMNFETVYNDIHMKSEMSEHINRINSEIRLLESEVHALQATQDSIPAPMYMAFSKDLTEELKILCMNIEQNLRNPATQYPCLVDSIFHSHINMKLQQNHDTEVDTQQHLNNIAQYLCDRLSKYLELDTWINSAIRYFRGSSKYDLKIKSATLTDNGYFEIHLTYRREDLRIFSNAYKFRSEYYISKFQLEDVKSPLHYYGFNISLRDSLNTLCTRINLLLENESTQYPSVIESSTDFFDIVSALWTGGNIHGISEYIRDRLGRGLEIKSHTLKSRSEFHHQFYLHLISHEEDLRLEISRPMYSYDRVFKLTINKSSNDST